VKRHDAYQVDRILPSRSHTGDVQEPEVEAVSWDEFLGNEEQESQTPKPAAVAG